ncbi:MAG: isocitrate lyase/phosphoenolpyruvate mutase family protein [Chloroflexia bacterium]
MNALTNMLNGKAALMVGGAFDALSARLVERAGFDAVWASGFSISASLGLPDANVMTASELVDRVEQLMEAVSIPVIVDCDEGYGSLRSTLRLARQLRTRGVQGMCIEDNSYPKLNSFLGGVSRALTSSEAFAAKIGAIKDAVPDMVVIARTEAIIADLGLDEAVDRGKLYAKSGADVVVLHSAYKHLDEFETLAHTWRDNTPLAVIPTMAPEVGFSDLVDLGFRVVIFANQALRASVLTMEEVLRMLHSTGRLSEIEGRLATMDHLFELTNLRDVP